MIAQAHANSDAEIAARLMRAYAERTGLTMEQPERRYLWSDAFAVCNLGALSRRLANESYLGLARKLVDRVHRTLGRHRSDDPRQGWLSGLDEAQGEEHPTRGGLRIGKPLPERPAGEAFDESLEWERDGQYFHYLTKWMHALDQLSAWTHEPQLNLWARELAQIAHAAFVYRPREALAPRMFWKMSVDLSRPLVPTMGHHDPLDGFVTCLQLRATASVLGTLSEGPSLTEATHDFAGMLEGASLATADPLGIGGLLMDACRAHQLPRREGPAKLALLRGLLAAAGEGLWRYAQQAELRQPASRRLAFRELGLAIGLSAIELIAKRTQAAPAGVEADTGLLAELGALRAYGELGSKIRSFWLQSESQRSATWSEHQDINEVMLATSLLPEGCLVLPGMSAAASG